MKQPIISVQLRPTLSPPSQLLYTVQLDCPFTVEFTHVDGAPGGIESFSDILPGGRHMHAFILDEDESARMMTDGGCVAVCDDAGGRDCTTAATEKRGSVMASSERQPKSGVTDYDRLVEQQDQELALYGEISPFTQIQLQAHAEGRSIPQIDMHAVTAHVRQMALERSSRARVEDDDAWLWDEEEE